MKLKSKSVPRVGPLNTVGHVVTELGKVYRAARAGRLDTLDGTRLASVLREIRSAIESDDIEKRLTALEDKSGYSEF
jgi:hypothetical protein